MKQRLLNAVKSLVGLAVILLLAWGFYWVLSRVVSVVLNLQSDVAVAIIAATVTITVSVFSLIVSKYQEQRQRITQEIREKKIPLYEKIIALSFDMFFAEKLGKPKPSETELMHSVAEIVEDLVIWGSDEVVFAFHKFRSSAARKDAISVLFRYEDLLLTIRKDLGHKNQNLKRGILLSLFINDIDQHIPTPNAKAIES